MTRIAGRFARVEPRRRVRDLVLGLLSDLPRKNCWSIAEWAGQASPHGPIVGRLDLDVESLELPAEPGLHLNVYTAPAGTPTADNLALLAS
ncbi:hypothetical protein [Streptomyces cavernae]|uniref:MmyB family transcriptional regulator n=1 Tax=Streptomyces cavernae TaxID=2259034 RepID=UPI000FEB6361